MQAEIWSKHFCPYCDRAKSLLKDLNIPYQEYIISPGYDEEQAAPNQQYVSKAALLQKLPTAKTVPQIWLDGEHIGGCTDLEARINSGQISKQ
jgi:glutaredoxin 3